MALSLPSYAPLNGSWIGHIDRYRSRYVLGEYEEGGFTFNEARSRATQCIIEAVQKARGLTTAALSDILMTLSPAGPEASRDLLWRWKRRGAVRYEDSERPNLHSAVALILGRYFHRAAKGWCPSIDPDEPLLWCWVEFPGHLTTRYMGAYPFLSDAVYLLPETTDIHTVRIRPPATEAQIRAVQASQQETPLEPGWYRLPAATLLYSPYEGLSYQQDGSLDPCWVRVDGGCVRFWRNDDVTLDDLSRWQPQVSRLELLPEQLIPDVVQAARVLSLHLLAFERIPTERGIIPWQTSMQEETLSERDTCMT